MCTLNAAGIFQELNPVFEATLGWTIEEMRYKSFRDYVHPGDLHHSIQLVEQTRTTGAPLVCRSRYRCANGSYQAISWQGKFDSHLQKFFVVGRPVAATYSTRYEAHEVAKRLEGMFDTLLEGVIILDAKNQITRANSAALKIFECRGTHLPPEVRAEWVTYHQDMQLCPIEDRPSARALRTGIAQTNQIYAMRKGLGSIKWINATAIPLFRDNDTAPYEVLLTITDITREQLDRAELLSVKDRLAERERFLDTMLSAIPSLVSYIDRNFRYRYVNRGYEIWFNTTVDQIIGKTVPAVLSEEVFRNILPYMQRAFAGETVEYELELNYTARGQRIVQCTYVPDFNKDGSVQGFYAIIHDISSQIFAQRSLRHKEEEIKRLLDMIPAAVSYWTDDLRNVYANEGVQKFYGLQRLKMQGQKIEECFTPELYDGFKERLAPVLRGDMQEFERDLPNLNGGTRHMHSYFLPDFVDGQVAGFLGFTTDVTKLKDLEYERHQMELRLMSASKLAALGEMAGGIAHEINNPLAIIMGKTAMLRTDVETSRVSASDITRELGTIETTVERIAKIIRGLRSFARDGASEPKFPTNLSMIVGQTLEACRAKIGAEQVELRIYNDTTVRVNCRFAQISQILLNLLHNALDAVKGAPDKWIELRAEQVDGIARVTITDSGPGIAPEIENSIMLPFFTTKEFGEGAGLGLSVAARLAADHGGSLHHDLSSKQTKFTLELPLDHER